MSDSMSDGPTETSTLTVTRPERLVSESTSTHAGAAIGAGAAAALASLRSSGAVYQTVPDDAELTDDTDSTSPHLIMPRLAPSPAQPPAPPLAAVLESRVAAAAARPLTTPPPPPERSVDFAPWAMTAGMNQVAAAASAGVIAARPVVPPPSFLVQIDPAKADDLRKIIAALTGQSKKNFTVASLVGVAPADSILETLSVRRVTTANVAFSKRAQQLTASGKEPALCLLRLERDERLLEARLTIRQSRGKTPSATMELTATAPTSLADDLAAFEELRAAIGALWGAAKV